MRRVLFLAVIALLAGGASPALAQFGQLDENAERDANATQLLDADVLLSGAYDSDTFAQPGVALSDQLVLPGYSAWAVGSLNYLRRFSAAQLQLGGGSALRYYPGYRDLKAVTHHAVLGVATVLPGRLALQLDEFAAYSPPYLYSLFPALPVAGGEDSLVVPTPTDQDYDLDSSSSYVSNTRIRLTRSLSARNDISAEGSLNVTDFATETALRRDLTTYSVSGRFSRNLSRNNVFSVNYRYRTATYAYDLNAIVAENSLNASVEMDRPVSASQRISLFFRVGATTVNIPEFLGGFEVGRTADARTVRMEGEVGAGYPFARTWNLRGRYNRGLVYVAGVTQPVFVDGFTGEITGLVARRLNVLARIGRTSGQSVLTGSGLLDTYTGTARLGYTINPRLEAYSEYIYYGYDTGSQAGLPELPTFAPGIPDDLERHGARAGVVLRVPVFRR